MKLKLIQPEKRRETGKFISINKAGLFHFSKDLGIALELKEEDKVSFYQDETQPKDWYFAIEKEGKNKIRKSYDGRGFMTNAQSISKEIKIALGKSTDKTLQIMVGQPTNINGIDYYPMLTAGI